MLADRERPEVAGMYDQVASLVAARARIIGEHDSDDETLEDADLAVVLGGDGMLLAQARKLVDRGVALVGVNFGRLGFLAEFDWESLQEHADLVFSGEAPLRERLVLEAFVASPGEEPQSVGIAINDCVVATGASFRVIDLALAIDGSRGPALRADGLIVATPIGSTAYNVSAGGPILHPGLPAIVITPIAAHSLAFRPIVTRPTCTVSIRVMRSQPGAAIVLDGDRAADLVEGQTVTVARYRTGIQFVGNPSSTYWGTLMDKLHWAAPPTYRRFPSPVLPS
jgi:NAD+ kinase